MENMNALQAYDRDKAQQELYELFLVVKTTDEVSRLLHDLCTPQEISSLADRWQICKRLQEGKCSYREISQETGASLATITRVARFLKDEPHQGYNLVLERLGLGTYRKRK